MLPRAARHVLHPKFEACVCDRATNPAVRGLGEKRIAKRGDPMEKKEVRREDVIEALKEIAFGRVNRGVELAYLEDPTAERIRKITLLERATACAASRTPTWRRRR